MEGVEGQQELGRARGPVLNQTGRLGESQDGKRGRGGSLGPSCAFCRRTSQSPDRTNDLPKVTQQVSSRGSPNFQPRVLIPTAGLAVRALAVSLLSS